MKFQCPRLTELGGVVRTRKEKAGGEDDADFNRADLVRVAVRVVVHVLHPVVLLLLGVF